MKNYRIKSIEDYCGEEREMKIDMFGHILTEGFRTEFLKKAPEIENLIELKNLPLANLRERFKIMDRYPDILQFITMAKVPLERYLSVRDSIEMARLGNDELAEVVNKYPDRFYGAAAVLPLNDMDATLRETDRAIKELSLKGVQIFTTINGETLDNPKFRPLYQKMEEYDLPIWIHPSTNDKLDDDYGLFSWEFDITNAMLAMVKSGVFVDFPKLKVIVHHAGAMVPIYSERIKLIFYDVPGVLPIPNLHEHFKKFYGDTAMYGNTSALMCAYEYFGADHLIFGTDAPLGPPDAIQLTIDSMDRMAVPADEKEKMYSLNAVGLINKKI